MKKLEQEQNQIRERLKQHIKNIINSEKRMKKELECRMLKIEYKQVK